jgi:hypothetical protein
MSCEKAEPALTAGGVARVKISHDRTDRRQRRRDAQSGEEVGQGGWNAEQKNFLPFRRAVAPHLTVVMLPLPLLVAVSAWVDVLGAWMQP